MNADPAEFKRLEKRLRAARTRALYWSGNPSFTGKRFRPNPQRGERRSHDDEYELAMCDVQNLQRRLTEMDGKPRKPYDPLAAFRARFTRAMSNRR